MLQDDESIPLELRHLPEYKELQELKRIRKHKIRELHSEGSLPMHAGYKVPHIPKIKSFPSCIMFWESCFHMVKQL